MKYNQIMNILTNKITSDQVIKKNQNIHFISYGDENFVKSKKRIYNEALNTNWFDSVTIYGPNNLDDTFKNNFSNILEMKRLGGYAIWKPYIIKKKLNEISENDILVYADCGCTINIKGSRRFFDYINMLNDSDSGIISFQNTHWFENQYTTLLILSNYIRGNYIKKK